MDETKVQTLIQRLGRVERRLKMLYVNRPTQNSRIFGEAVWQRGVTPTRRFRSRDPSIHESSNALCAAT